MGRACWRRLGALILWLLVLLPPALANTLRAQTPAQLEAARRKLVDEVIVPSGVRDPRVVQAMRTTPRHAFVPRHLRGKAYLDMSLPIGDRQTISSPFIVAFMTEALDPQPGDKVLEIGTGSGYQAAVLSPLVQAVYTIEIVESLGRTARQTLAALDYDNVHVKIGDGFQGWPEKAPFDKIIVTCSPEEVPRPLVDQLREGGRMVVPVGERYQQILYVMRKRNGRLEREALRPTLFVPMTGKAESLRAVQPDPARPQVANGSFEEPPQGEFQPGWYYQRQAARVADASAPEGSHYIRLSNEDPGRSAHLLQGFPVDGREVRQLTLSCRVRYDELYPGRSRKEMPLVAVSFYDSDRSELTARWLGPFRGSADWHRLEKEIQVPPPRTRGNPPHRTVRRYRNPLRGRRAPGGDHALRTWGVRAGGPGTNGTQESQGTRDERDPRDERDEPGDRRDQSGIVPFGRTVAGIPDAVPGHRNRSS